MFVVKNATMADDYLLTAVIHYYSNDTPEEGFFVDSTNFLLLVLDVLFYALFAAVVISIVALYCVKLFFSFFPARRALV